MRNVLVVLLVATAMAVMAARAPDFTPEETARMQKYHVRRNSGQVLAEKWSRGNLTGQEKDDLFKAMAFEMYGIE